VRNEEILHRVKKEENTIHTANRRKDNWIGHILCRNCLLKHVIEGKIKGSAYVIGRRDRRRKQLLDDLEEREDMEIERANTRSQTVENSFVIQPTRCTNFTNLFCHETLHVSDSSSVHHQEFIHCTLSSGICHTGL
jgi:hypothetical protein